MKNRTGFTVVELMVAVSIMGILAALAGPSIMNYLNTRGLTNAANQVFNDMHRIRTRAVKSRYDATITITPGAQQYQATLDDPVTSGTDITLPPVSFSGFRGGVKLEGASEYIIEFNNQGGCPTAESIFLTNKGNTARYRVRTTLAGGISLHVWSNGAWIAP